MPIAFSEIYRCPLEAVAAPSGASYESSWIVPLSDGSALLTLLYRDADQQPRTTVWQLSPAGAIRPWPPGQGYPAPAIAYANARDELYGFDYTRPGKLYVCKADGTHLATLTCTPAPQPAAFLSLLEIDGLLHLTTPDGQELLGILPAGEPRGELAVELFPDPEAEEAELGAVSPMGMAIGGEDEAEPPADTVPEDSFAAFSHLTQLHAPHCHVCGDGCLYVLHGPGHPHLLLKYRLRNR